jgi:solute:Na+ symporter, SSS family
MNVVATSVFIFFFLLVTVLGFWASRWKAGDLNSLHQWGLGGRQFGPWVTWFLIGGDLYTAYTVIAVPGLVYALGAYGFFAVPYTVLVYPLAFLLMPRFWNVCAKRGYVTAGDFVLGRFGSKWLELAVAVTGILATMPYIALQLVGMELVIRGLGFQGEGLMAHVPLTIAFVILALYTYSAGLRAPAVIAFVKDIMVYVFVIAAVIYIPYQLGGFGSMFDGAGKVFEGMVSAGAAANPPKVVNAGLTLPQSQIWPFLTLAVGSTLALFMYPHSLTGVLSANGPKAIRFNMTMLPLYSLVLGLIALFGLMGRAAGLDLKNTGDVVPQLFLKYFPDWFVGFSFAAIAIAALVPAAMMSIGAANTFTRNIWRPFVNSQMTDKQESDMAKLISLVVKVGALLIIVGVQTQFALNFQLLGGIIMLQIFPALCFGLFTRKVHGQPLLIGWAVGMMLSVLLIWISRTPAGAIVPMWSSPLGIGLYIGVVTVSANALVSYVLSLVTPNVGTDQTMASDYLDAKL